MFYIQLLGILAFCILVLSFYKKNTVTILTYQITSNFIYAIHYFLLGGLSGAFCSIIGIIRNIVFMKISKNKFIWSIIFLILYISVTFIFYEKLYSLLPMIGNYSYLITMTKNNRKALLIGGIINSVMWLIYSIFVGSYACFFTESIIIVSNTIQLTIDLKHKKC